MSTEALKRGYVQGPICVKTFGVLASNTIAADDMIHLEADTGLFYARPAASGETVIGSAINAVTSEPATSGAGLKVQVNIDPNAIYEYDPSTGTVTLALLWRTFDAGGAQSVLISAPSNSDLLCVGINTDHNTLYVKILTWKAGVAYT